MLAIKIIDTKDMGPIVKNVKNEVEILKKVNHPNIIALHEVFQIDTKLYIVVDLYESCFSFLTLYFW